MPNETSMPLSALLADVRVIEILGDPNVAVSSITHDSRRAGPGALFVAYRGVYQDVHRFIPDAVARGATAVVVERPLDDLRAEMELPGAATYIRVRRARRTRSALACALHANPSDALTVVGVTGTDGKTTTSTLIHAIVTASGRRAGLVSTVAADVGNTTTLDTGLHTTTPEPEDLHAYLGTMRDTGVEVAVLEVTSHGLAQERVTHVGFDVGVITNITREALEYHQSFEAYVRAKTRLFHLVAIAGSRRRISADAGGEPPRDPSCGMGAAVLNAGDPSYAALSRINVRRRLVYGGSDSGSFTAREVSHTPEGLSFTADTPRGSVHLRSYLLGSYNVDNILAAIAAAHALDIGTDAWIDGVASVRGIPGRMEPIDEGQSFVALVDFAHTPNALRSALSAVRNMGEDTGRVIVVLGCAGLRDRGKRPLMGRIAGELADLTIVTAEDPRTDDLETILQEIGAGLAAAGAVEGRNFALVPDRFRAIRRACAMAGPGDVVLVAGKGHEQSMCFDDTEYPWDDRMALRAALRGNTYGDLPTAMRS